MSNVDAAPPAVPVAASVAVAPHADTDPPAAPRQRVRPSGWLIFAGLTVLALAGWISAVTADRDSGTDLLGLARQTSTDLGHLHWQFAAVVVVLAGSHYLATAIAARAVSGLSLPLGETLLVQLAAAAANRLTPAGLGGSALTARYFSRRGLDTPAAIGAVVALAVVGSGSGFVVLGALVLVGTSLGLRGSTHEFVLLARHVTSLPGPARSPWLWIVVAGVLIAVGVLYSIHRRRGGRVIEWSHAAAPVRQLARRPGALATLIIASGTTTLILALAFVATIAMVPGRTPSVGVVAVLVAFMLGSAAGTAIPVPAGLGSTEAAFVAILTSFQVPVAHAIEIVLLFRIITFWAPAAVGVLATRRLYKLKAL
jgi:uncharacterized membrane protein YbhN (UPF0104 family)